MTMTTVFNPELRSAIAAISAPESHVTPPPKMAAMIDLETMASGPNAAIASIGAVKWPLGEQDPTSGFEPFYVRVDLRTSQACGGIVDADTVLWWMQQSEEARRQIFSDGGLHINVALLQLRDFLKDCVEVWAKPADFDLPILESAYVRSCFPLPYERKSKRCWSTLRRYFALPEQPNPGAHNAAADALCQAVDLRRGQQFLQQWYSISSRPASTIP